MESLAARAARLSGRKLADIFQPPVVQAKTRTNPKDQSIAARAARLCGLSRPDSTAPPETNTTDLRPAWRRAPRTKAVLAIKVLAIEKAAAMLQDLNIPFTQPLAGKLVVEPPPRIEGGKAVTFWPVKERLRIQRRPTKQQQDIHAFKQALADQGHRIPGYRARKPAKALRRWLVEQERATRARARQERLRAKQEEDLAEKQRYLDLSRTSFRQIGEDIEAGIKRRGSPRSARVKRLFQRGIRRR